LTTRRTDTLTRHHRLTPRVTKQPFLDHLIEETSSCPLDKKALHISLDPPMSWAA
jgi:hypothetical protein